MGSVRVFAVAVGDEILFRGVTEEEAVQHALSADLDSHWHIVAWDEPVSDVCGMTFPGHVKWECPQCSNVFDTDVEVGTSPPKMLFCECGCDGVFRVHWRGKVEPIPDDRQPSTSE